MTAITLPRNTYLLRGSGGRDLRPALDFVARDAVMDMADARLTVSVPAAQTQANSFIGSMEQTGGASLPGTLGTRIAATKYAALIDPKSADDFAAARSDARKIADKYFSDLSPRITVSEDGAILLDWQNRDRGVALVFIGDGTVVYSVGTENKAFSETGIELNVNAPLDREIVETVRSFAPAK